MPTHKSIFDVLSPLESPASKNPTEGRNRSGKPDPALEEPSIISYTYDLISDPCGSFMMNRVSDELHDIFVQERISKCEYYVEAKEKAARQHYHFVFQCDVGESAIKKSCGALCKSLGLSISKGKANAWYGGTKVVDKLKGALSYCMKDAQVFDDPSGNRYDLTKLKFKGFTEEYLQAIPRWDQREDGLVVATDISGETVIVREKKRNMREVLVKYLHEEKGWEYYERNPTPQEVFHEVFNKFEGAFNNPNGVVMVRHALYVFSDTLRRDELEQRIFNKICYDI